MLMGCKNIPLDGFMTKLLQEQTDSNSNLNLQIIRIISQFNVSLISSPTPVGSEPDPNSFKKSENTFFTNFKNLAKHSAKSFNNLAGRLIIH
jgi:hypothetical protein